MLSSQGGAPPEKHALGIWNLVCRLKRNLLHIPKNNEPHEIQGSNSGKFLHSNMIERERERRQSIKIGLNRNIPMPRFATGQLVAESWERKF